MKSSKPKVPDAEALKSIIGAMKKLDLDRINGYKDADDDDEDDIMEDVPVIQIKKKDKDDESED